MSRIAYLALFAVVVLLAMLWLVIGDFVGAFWSLAVLALASILVIAVAGYLVANFPTWSRAIRGISWEAHLERLERDGEAIRERYEVSRGISFQDWSTGCLAHLLDIGDRELLCLYGQSYFDFEPIHDDPDVNQPRKFPTKVFSLLRSKSSGEVLALFPGAEVFEPTDCGGIVAPEKALTFRLKDGEVIQNKLFEDVERICRLAGARARAA